MAEPLSNSYISKSELEEYLRNRPTLIPSAEDLARAVDLIDPLLDIPEDVRAAAASLAIQLIRGEIK